MRISALLTILFASIMRVAPLSSVAAPITYALNAARPEIGFVFTLNKAQAKGEMPLKSANIVIDTVALDRSNVDVTVDVRRGKRVC